MPKPPIYPGDVDWSGENPGMYLKESTDGPFVTLLSFFRVVLSPHGRGTALVMLRSPTEERPPEARSNLCITDNEKLARYLVAGFVGSFAAFKGLPGLKGLSYRKMTGGAASGDPASTYVETVSTAGLDVRLSWEGLGQAFALEMPVEKSATGKHIMLSVFASAERAGATVNGARLPGRPVPRDMAGRQITTAFLAFSETWIKA
ncbi:MAG: hypothetical protein HYR63_15435 [Proteobacteria bacterium]|nr:hypothetical protein [Pseudomonadota bacterium]